MDRGSAVNTSPRATLFVRLCAALASGAVLMFVSPPVNLHGLHWFSFLPLFWALRPGEHRTNAKLGYAAGWIAVFLLFYWLVDTIRLFSSLPFVAALLVQIVFASAFAIPYALVFGSVHWLRERFGAGWVWLVPAVLVAAEKLSPALFPYYQGVSQYRNPYTWQLASVFGAYGLSYLVMLTNAALAEGLFYRRAEGAAQPWRLYGAVLAIFLGNIGFGAWRHAAVEQELASARILQVSLLQDDVTMDERRFTSAREDLNAWVRLTRQLDGKKVDLVVWPEGAVPYNPSDPKVLEYLGKLTSSGGYELLVGGGTSEKAPPETGRKYIHYNSCYLIDRAGALKGRYDKMVPLPFGEYIPFSETFPFLNGLIEGPGDFRAGKTPTVFQADGYTFTVPICYEAILDRQMWKLKDADLFVNITNDAWFGDTASPWQHAMLSAVQATQYGRPLLRVAYTGVCMVVEPHGDILYETKPFVEFAGVVPLRLAQVETAYVRGGWVFAWLCVAASAMAWGFGRGRAPRSPASADDARPVEASVVGSTER